MYQKAIGRFIGTILITITLLFTWSAMHITLAQHNGENMNIPVITSYADYQELFQRAPEDQFPYKEKHRVKIIGTYTRVDLRKNKPIPNSFGGFPSEPDSYVKPISIELAPSDGRRPIILIYPSWHPESARPEEEIEAYEGKQVVVTGDLWQFSPPPPSPPGLSWEEQMSSVMVQSMGESCLFPMESIELVEDAARD